jgi:hypothetical protein
VDAHAVTLMPSPFGNEPVTVRIGSHPTGQWIGWQNQNTQRGLGTSVESFDYQGGFVLGDHVEGIRPGRKVILSGEV